MPELRTREQVEEYLRQAGLIPENRAVNIYQTEFAWVCWTPMNPQEQAIALERPGTGGCRIVDARTGVVTGYGSARPPILWGEMYDQSIRTGQPMIAGNQIYPHRWKLTIQQTRQDQTEIEYRVTAESLTEPPEPTTDLQLIVNKETHRYRTNTGEIPPSATHALGWVNVNRQNGIWPEHLTHEY